MPDLEQLGYAIRKAREAKNMSQQELGRRLGLSAAAVSLLETGRTKFPKVSRLVQIAEILEIPSTDLLAEAGFNLPDSDSLSLQWLADEMDAGNRRRLIAIGHALLQEQKRQPQRANRSGSRRPPEGQ
jgi:transcriptional regulator with XRE-family HTH domain